ncbi:MAG: hypothetical protein R2838_20965 [Caldilineaceae bacterium]
MTLCVEVVAGAETITGLAAGSTSPTPLGDATTFFATVEAGTSVTFGWIFGEREHGHRHPRGTHLRRAGQLHRDGDGEQQSQRSAPR